VALLIYGSLAFAVSRRAGRRAPLWLTLPAAFAGVAAPPALVYALILSVCGEGGCD
jgi:hypothetical protein